VLKKELPRRVSAALLQKEQPRRVSAAVLQKELPRRASTHHFVSAPSHLYLLW
jgi:hypothetical protein